MPPLEQQWHTVLLEDILQLPSITALLDLRAIMMINLLEQSENSTGLRSTAGRAREDQKLARIVNFLQNLEWNSSQAFSRSIALTVCLSLVDSKDSMPSLNFVRHSSITLLSAFL